MFDLTFEQLRQYPAIAPIVFEVDVPIARSIPEARLAGEILRCHVRVLNQRIGHRVASRRRPEVDFGALVGDDAGAGHPARHFAHQLFGKAHQVFERAVSLVELQHRELRIVPPRQAFVSETPVDFIYAFKTADRQSLQIQLRGNTQVEVHVECIVSRNERPRRGSAGNRMHHRRFHFEVAPGVEEPPQFRQQPRAHREARARLFAHDEIEIALPVPDFGIREAVVFLGQRPQRLGQHVNRLCSDGEFAPVGPHEGPRDADDIANVVQLAEVRVGGITDIVAAQIALNAAAAVLQRDETRLAHDPAQHHASGDRDGYGLLFKRRLVSRRVRFVQLCRQRRALEPARVCQATFSQRGQFAAADRQDVVLFRHQSPNPVLRLASMKSSRSPSRTLFGSPRSMPVLKSLTRD